MAEPLSTGATATVAGWGIVTSALVGFITSVDYSIAFGAFTGSMCFIVTVSDLTRRQIFGYCSLAMQLVYLEPGLLRTK
ncbi:putative holin [Pantoea anthophila]|uniref:putative holin n=1 Tax=Pantoea anthophila TaxID=470931 RepID=UPI003CEB043C